MSKYDELRELAGKATPGPWWIDSHGHRMSTEDGMKTVFIASDRMGPSARHKDSGNLSHWPNDWDASFIATANPATVLDLLADYDALAAENGQLRSEVERITAEIFDRHRKEADEFIETHWRPVAVERDHLRAELAKARELLEDVRDNHQHAIHWEDLHPAMVRVREWLERNQ